MTTITDYSSLITAVTEYLAREEDATLIARIPTFIQLSEAKMNRNLFVRQMEVRATALVNMSSAEPQYISLPLTFQSMRRVRITSDSTKPTLNYITPAQMDEWRATTADASGEPLYFTIFGSEMELYPTPDSAYTIEMIYRSLIPALTTLNTTNWLLTLAPDAYLYGALLEASPYIKDDNRLQVWGAAFTSTIDGLSSLGLTSTYNAGPLQMRITGRTP